MTHNLLSFSIHRSIQWVSCFLLLITLLINAHQVVAQSNFFVPVSLDKARLSTPASTPILNAKAYQINEANLRAYVGQAPLETTTGATPLRLTIPLPDGTIESFLLRQTQTLSPALAAENPTFKTFAGQGERHTGYIIRMSLTSLGFEATIWGVGGDAVYFVKTSPDPTNDLYLSYFARDYRKAAPARAFGPPLRCGSVNTATDKPTLPGFEQINKKARSTAPTSLSMGSTMRTFRLAVATTGEWTRNAGGYPTVTDTIALRTNALAKITAAVNRLNGIFERDLASRFLLVNPSVRSDKNLLYDDPATDPYDNSDKPTQLAINQTALTNRVGTANYDIGHLFGTAGGGVAIKGALCDDKLKAQGYSARELSTDDPFVVDYVAHEIGHQFGMDHTYNQSDPKGSTCTTREASQAYEVASGSTIMSYVGICNDGRNLQQYVDVNVPSFHVTSLVQANDYLTTEAATCGTSAGRNTIPKVGAGASYAIPRLTPFRLTATGSDADTTDVNQLQYAWEEYDLAPSASGELGIPLGTFDVDDDTIRRPLFRNYSPIASPQRTFPSLQFVLNSEKNAVPGDNQPVLTFTGTHPTNAPGATCPTGNTCVVGERLPTVARTLNFRVTVRDQRGGVADAPMSLTVVNTPGAFRLTAFDSASSVAGNSQQTIAWNVVNTDKAPINCANVRLLFSADGGLTFPITLLASTPNSGTATVQMPNVATEKGRIRLEAVGNVFFDINNASLTITAATSQTLGVVAVSGSACVGSTAMASVSATGGTAPYSYTWNAPSGLTFTGTSSTTLLSIVSSRTTGTQTLTLVVADAQSMTATTQVSLLVSAPPAVTITVSPAASVTQNASLTLVASGAARYLWSTRDTTASITPLTSATGTLPFSVTGTAINGCSSVASLTVTVKGRGDTTKVIGALPGGQLANGSADTFRATILGNPSTEDEVDVAIQGTNHEPLTVKVLSAQGRLLSQQQIETTDQEGIRHRIRLSDGPGLYFIQISTPSQTRVLKVSRL